MPLILPRERHTLVGPVGTLLLVALTELLTHVFDYDTLGVTLFLLSLAPIAYGGLRAGFGNSLVSTAILALYTLHFVADDPHQVARFDGEALTSFAIVLFLGVAMGWPMSRVRAREMRLRDELERRARDLEARNRELMSANASLEAFGYVVSHDLKEPVRALENYIEAAREEYPSAESRMYLEEAHQANRRLARLLQGLLSYSRTSSLPATPEPIALTEVLTSEACAAQYAGLQAERGAKVDIAEDLPPVLGDRVILAQLFGNLILNAIRHDPKPARVQVRALAAEPSCVHVVVEDVGPGFPKDVLARFGILETGRPATIKTGFGLAIAHRAAERSGGRLWLENAPGGGAQAHVELPAARPEGVSEVRKVRSSPDPRNDPEERLLSGR